jgi:5'-3' exonuclease
MNTDRTLLNKARVLLGLEVKLEQMKLDNGAILEAEVFEAGAEVFVVADEERVAVPVGEYEVEGKTIVVSEEGVIGEIKEAGAEEEAPATEEEVEEEELSTETASPKKIVKSISEEMFFSEIEKLRTEINELKLSKTEVVAEEVQVELSEEVKEDKVELSAEEVEGITHTPENLSNKKELNLYSQKGNKNTTRNRIFNKLNK